MHLEAWSLQTGVKLPDSGVLTFHLISDAHVIDLLRTPLHHLTLLTVWPYCTDGSLPKRELLGFLVDFPVTFVTTVSGSQRYCARQLGK